MKNIIPLILAIIAVASTTSCGSTPDQNKTPDTLKVMAWNIWHEGQHKAHGKTACEATLEILKTSQADILTIVETYGAADKIADKLGYYHRLLSSNLSIYSKYPITKTITFPDSISTFNFGGVEINVDGQKMRVFATWLHYIPDARKVPTNLSETEILAWENSGSRDDEAAKILNCIAPFLEQTDSIPVIMAGDFNNHSHLDWTDQTKNMYHHGGAVVNWTVSNEMAAAGFKDSFRIANPKPETIIGTTWLHPNNPETEPNRFDRIDYIYYKGKALNATKSEAYNAIDGEMIDFKGKNLMFGPDHGLVLTTFSYKPEK